MSPGKREWMCVLCLPFGYFFTARSRKPGLVRSLIGVYGLTTGKNWPFGLDKVRTAEVRSSPLTVLSEGSAKRKRLVS